MLIKWEIRPVIADDMRASLEVYGLARHHTRRAREKGKDAASWQHEQRSRSGRPAAHPTASYARAGQPYRNRGLDACRAPGGMRSGDCGRAAAKRHLLQAPPMIRPTPPVPFI